MTPDGSQLDLVPDKGGTPGDATAPQSTATSATASAAKVAMPPLPLPPKHGQGGRSIRHTYAHMLAAAGYPVFPCHVDKTPATEHGHLDATTNIAAIDRMWFAGVAKGEDYNIAMEPGRVGWRVIDQDMKPGLDGHAEFQTLCDGLGVEDWERKTFRVKTPRGFHNYYIDLSETKSPRLAPAVDTRGNGGYVLLPTSETEHGVYTIINDGPVAPLPAPIAAKLVQKDHKVEAPASTNLDTPEAVFSARSKLHFSDGAVEGNNGDDKTFALAAWIKDEGISEEMCFALMTETPKDEHGKETGKSWNDRCSPPWPHDELRVKIKNAYRYGQNAVGARQQQPLAERFKDLLANRKPLANDNRNSFIGREPDEDEAAPDIIFWDEEKTLPRTEDGDVVILFAKYGQHKTGVALSLGLDVIQAGGTVLYVPGEGRHGVGKSRLPAACRARGLTTKALRGKWHTARRAPNLSSFDEVREFIAAFQTYFGGKPPSFVIIDTLATAKGGVDENSAAFGDLITDTGPVGQIKRAFGHCLVLLLHHSGKDETKGARGHSSLGGNANGIFAIESVDKEAGTLELTIEKMRDAESDFSVAYAITPRGQVPVLTKRGRVGKGDLAALPSSLLMTVRAVLEQYRPGESFSMSQFTRMTLAHDNAEVGGFPLGDTDLSPAQLKAFAARSKQLRRLIATGAVNTFIWGKPSKRGSHTTQEYSWARPGLNEGGKP
jgi:hypothetical protein